MSTSLADLPLPPARFTAPTAEARAFAKALMRDIAESDDRHADMVERVRTMLRQRLEKKPSLRVEMLNDIARLWRTTAPEAALCPVQLSHDPLVSQYRLASFGIRKKSWVRPQFEMGITAHLATLSVTRTGPARATIETDYVPLIHMSEHCLCRFWERAFCKTLPVLIEDIRLMLLHPLAAGFKDFSSANGTWLGERLNLPAGHKHAGRSILSLRTFVL